MLHTLHHFLLKNRFGISITLVLQLVFFNVIRKPLFDNIGITKVFVSVLARTDSRKRIRLCSLLGGATALGFGPNRFLASIQIRQPR